MWTMCSVDELVLCLNDIDEHIGKHIDRFDNVYKGFDVDQSNFKKCHYDFSKERIMLKKMYGLREEIF